MPTDIIVNHEKEEQTPKVLELPIGLELAESERKATRSARLRLPPTIIGGLRPKGP
jgi:hypothetical protein